MRETLKPYAKVEVVALVGSTSLCGYFEASPRAPVIGDQGTLIYVFENIRGLRKYFVTGLDNHDQLIWSGLFVSEELHIIESAEPAPRFDQKQILSHSPDAPQLFVWREWKQEQYLSRDSWYSQLQCVYCNTPLELSNSAVYPEEQDTTIDTASYTEATCPLCGWAKRRWISYHTDMPGINSGRWATFREMRNFEISSPKIAISELGAHLRRQYADVFSITPRRFEQLVAEIFRNMGWTATLTPQTRDGGVDIYLFENSSNEKAIVECKRYKGKIGIGIVNNLLGVQLATGSNSAYLVTTSSFTDPAQTRAASPSISTSGFKLNLIDAEELTRYLEVFNATLPPQHLMKALIK